MTVAEHYARTWLSRLRLRLAHAEVALRIGNFEAVAEMVRRSQVELGIVETPTLPRDLRRRRLGYGEVVLAVRPGHLWAARPVSLVEVAQTPVLVREPGSGPGAPWSESCNGRG